MAETKILQILMCEEHFYLIVGTFSVLYFLRAVKPVAFIFSKKWNWLIPILNLGFSFAGIFMFRLTVAKTMGMKLSVMFLITAVTSYTYELTKPLLKKIVTKFIGIEPGEKS